ncbi:MAG: hypothetical protein U5Q44_11860 [Dehalococcoidia bacterium]|nr:hypothetical protein [Dehalococcoidia bacterium]
MELPRESSIMDRHECAIGHFGVSCTVMQIGAFALEAAEDDCIPRGSSGVLGQLSRPRWTYEARQLMDDFAIDG